MVNGIGFPNVSTGLDAMELTLLSPTLQSLFLDDVLELSGPFAAGTPVEDFTDRITNELPERKNPYTKPTARAVLPMEYRVDEISLQDTLSQGQRTVEYYGFRTVKFDSTQQATFFDIKTGEIAFGSEVVIEAIPLEAIAHFKQIGEPTWGLMETNELYPGHQKLVQCTELIKKMSSRFAIGSVIVGTAAGLTSLFFPAALPVAGFFLSQSFYPAIAYWVSRGIRKAAHFTKQVKFECVTKSEVDGRENIEGVKFTGTLPATEFNFVREQLSSKCLPILNLTKLKNSEGFSVHSR